MFPRRVVQLTPAAVALLIGSREKAHRVPSHTTMIPGTTTTAASARPPAAARPLLRCRRREHHVRDESEVVARVLPVRAPVPEPLPCGQL